MVAARLGATALDAEVRIGSAGPVVAAGAGRWRRSSSASASDLTLAAIGTELADMAVIARCAAADACIVIDAGPQMVCVADAVEVAESIDPQRRGVLVEHRALQQLKPSVEVHLASLAEAGVGGLRLGHRSWTAGLVTMCHRFGRLAVADGISHTREAAAALAVGMDVVIGTHADRLVDGFGQVYQGQ